MENTNTNPEIPTQSFTSPVQQSPKENNLFKYLFFVSIIILLIVITGFVLNDKNIKKSLVEENINNVSTVIPTKIINEATPTSVSKIDHEYEASFIKDDKNSISKLVLIDKNQKEIVLSESKYMTLGGEIIKPKYQFVFSSDKSYLAYTLTGYEGGFSGIYDIKNKIKADIPFLASSINFNDSNTFFYACVESGIGGGGAVVYKLPGLVSVYNKAGSFNCEYNKINNSLNIVEGSLSGENSDYFSFTSGTILK